MRYWSSSTIRPTSMGHFLAKPIRSGASPGLIAAIVDRRGVRAIAAAGVRKAGDPQPLLTTDSIHIGSNTKAMTATLLAVLVRDGVFDDGWNTTIADVFPEAREDIHPEYRRVTLWQLVTMTGGVRCDAADWHAHRDADLIGRRHGILRDNLADPPAATAGEHLYSNLAYVVAGAMAERITGKTWETLMQERLFEPLGMASAGFGPPGTSGEDDQPWGHQRDPDRDDWVPNQLDNAAAMGPAGTVHVAIEDWAKFISLWLTEGPPAILDREGLDRLITPVSGRYAAGWSVATRFWAKGEAITHGGSNTSWFALLWIAPRIGHAYVAAANSPKRMSAAPFVCFDRIVSKLIRATRRPRGVARLFGP
ncbi:MAG: beta-lactamase family protein [Gammaproteobacteria bacterium]|nr:beta-lactamase family protein [Gammaproteobacteria bacterium]